MLALYMIFRFADQFTTTERWTIAAYLLVDFVITVIAISRKKRVKHD